jgi:two-component system, NtrC family, nitrogen regulation sensor histidine kinase NtrY
MSSLLLIRRHLRDYRVQLALRAATVAFAASGAAVLAVVGGGAAIAGATLLALVSLALLAHLVRFAQRPLRDVARFIEGIRYDDLTLSVAERDGGPLLRALAAGFSEVGDALGRLRSEREEQARYLDMVIRHVPVALLGVGDGGEITLINPAARRLLGIPRIRHVAQLRRVGEALAAAVESAASGDRRLVRIERDNRAFELALDATRFTIGGETTTLVSLQDIRQELEEKELEAWQQLTRVLTHEIVNSVTPIASLASTASERVQGAPPADASLREVREALETIERRSQGLVRFVDAYRSLTRLPQPRIERVAVSDLFAGTRMLVSQRLQERGVRLHISIEPPGHQIGVDPELIEQVLLNLVLNALEALEGRPESEIRLMAEIDEAGRSVLEVIDNGPGIDEDVQDRIFVPFFTTKRTGSGIGLSLSRQIVRLHGGSLTVRSEPGRETAFTLRL